jgi:hypothetical protein
MGWALPLRRWRGFVYRRSALRFSDIWVERGHASIDAFYLPCSSTPLQSITAATSHRVPVPILGLTGVCAGQNTGGDQGAAAHPASGPPCGWGPDHRAGRCEQARHSGPEGGPDRSASSLARRSRPRPGADCLFLPAVRRERKTVERTATNCVTSPASRWEGRVLRVGVTDRSVARHPERLRESREGGLSGLPGRKRLGNEVRRPSQSRPEGCLARGIPTEVGARGARHAAGTR